MKRVSFAIDADAHALLKKVDGSADAIISECVRRCVSAPTALAAKQARAIVKIARTTSNAATQLADKHDTNPRRAVSHAIRSVLTPILRGQK